jgi:Domain of unknown function (DUF4133)
MHTINKGINKTAEFKGVKGTYIYILLGVFFFNFMLVMLLQILGVPSKITYPVVLLLAVLVFGVLYWFVRRFGEYGFWKFIAMKRQPKKIKNTGMGTFRELVTNKKL